VQEVQRDRPLLPRCESTLSGPSTPSLVNTSQCPTAEARTCRNCGSADHMAKECDQPRNPATVTCRNCEKVGHFSRECPEPKDWSKVQCQNCQEFGHTIKVCCHVYQSYIDKHRLTNITALQGSYSRVWRRRRCQRQHQRRWRCFWLGCSGGDSCRRRGILGW
jgi:hypothetical protein